MISEASLAMTWVLLGMAWCCTAVPMPAVLPLDARGMVFGTTPAANHRCGQRPQLSQTTASQPSIDDKRQAPPKTSTKVHSHTCLICVELRLHE